MGLARSTTHEIPHIKIGSLPMGKPLCLDRRHRIGSRSFRDFDRHSLHRVSGNSRRVVAIPGHSQLKQFGKDIMSEQLPTGMKLVQIRLSAMTRVQYTETVAVPDNLTPAELNDLVNARYSQVDGGDFQKDRAYWKRDTCTAVDSTDPNAEPSMVAFRTETGLHIERAGQFEPEEAEVPDGNEHPF